VQTSEKLMQYLITLGKSRMSKSFLLRQLLSQISALADRLWLSFETQFLKDMLVLSVNSVSCVASGVS
ncbi:hypothetical protein JOQ06_004952, partial [Pogonophryne albipinna]